MTLYNQTIYKSYRYDLFQNHTKVIIIIFFQLFTPCNIFRSSKNNDEYIIEQLLA